MADLPFLSKKNKKESGTGMTTVVVRDNPEATDTKDKLLERVAEELMTAIHKKDVKSLREALEAICINVKDQDNG